MGMRIHKDIGYLLTHDILSSVVVDNYSDILENLDDDDEASKQFFIELENLLQSYTDSKKNPEHILVGIIGRNFAAHCEEKKHEPFHFVTQFFMCDDDQGILFRSKELFKACRFDDLIDYYETSIYEHKINYLNRPIYPCSGYIYKGGLEDKFPELTIGHVYEEFEVKHQYLVDVESNGENDDSNITSSGYFTPNIESFVYLAAKAAGILKSEVTEYEFNCAVKPMIATYWS